MRSRIFIAAIYLAALLSLAYGMRLPVWIWFLLAAGAVPAVFLRNSHPAIRFIAELVMAGAALLFFHPLGLLVQTLMAIAALSISRAQYPNANRAILGGLVITVVAAYLRPLASVGFIALAGLSVFALVESGPGERETARQRTRLALTLALITAVGAAAAALLVRLLPWQYAVAAIFTAVAYPFLKLFSLVHLHPHRRQPQKAQAGQGSHHVLPHAAGHTPAIVTTILVILGILLLALIIYAAYRHWAQNVELPDDTSFEQGILRETLSEQTEDWLGRRRRAVTPVRRLVQIRHHHARARNKTRQPGETWREWVSQHEPDLDPEATDIYESVRYGDAPDTKDAARRLNSLWPRR
jgi:predicted membrane protein